MKTGQIDYFTTDKNGHPLSVAPPNQGPKGTPNYETALGQPSVFTLANGMRIRRSARRRVLFRLRRHLRFSKFPLAGAGLERQRRYGPRSGLPSRRGWLRRL